MSLTDKDPYNARETLRLARIGVKIARREAKGKPTAALEAEADRIRDAAIEREVQAEEQRDRERTERAARRVTDRRIRAEEREKARKAKVRQRAAAKYRR